MNDKLHGKYLMLSIFLKIIFFSCAYGLPSQLLPKNAISSLDTRPFFGYIIILFFRWLDCVNQQFVNLASGLWLLLLLGVTLTHWRPGPQNIHPLRLSPFGRSFNRSTVDGRWHWESNGNRCHRIGWLSEWLVPVGGSSGWHSGSQLVCLTPKSI